MNFFAILLLGVCCEFCYANFTVPEEAPWDGRIFGGSAARLGQFPFQARLQIRGRGGSFLCGGSLISDSWVLTAAHCTQGATNIAVQLGITDSNSRSGVRQTASSHHEHPNYNSKQIVNDIALVKLPQKVTLNSNVNTIQLPKQRQMGVDFFVGKRVVISGWGRTRNNQNSGNRYLQFATAVMMSHAACRNYYRRFTVTNGEICTDNSRTRTGTCSGDSGGPLTIEEAGKRILIGVTSWGVESCETRAPSVYTNVAAYLGFIHSITKISLS